MSNSDWQIPKGETDSLLIQVLNNGTPVDITDSTIYFTVKRLDSDADSAAVIKKIITEHVDAINGQSRLELTSADTNIPKERYLYDLVIVFLSGERQHLIPPSYFEITSTIIGLFKDATYIRNMRFQARSSKSTTVSTVTVTPVMNAI